jgi:hypothetical protein
MLQFEHQLISHHERIKTFNLRLQQVASNQTDPLLPHILPDRISASLYQINSTLGSKVEIGSQLTTFVIST